ncbi:MAG TPA: hypothetical protein DCW29_00305 [Janthinobacterium sp.]|nr:hypothetical protein [Janthinobacterium sp.]
MGIRLRRAIGAGLLLACAALAGCATAPAEHFYTLAGAAAPARSDVNYYVEVLAVNLPPQVSRNQLVVTGAGGRIELLEQERWAGPLAAEVGQALSLGVTGELGAIDVYRTPYPETLPVYRISTNVQRFESVLGQYALIDAVWSVRQLSTSKVLTCRSVVKEGVDAGYDSLVAGHRRALRRVAAQMARAIRGFGGSGGDGRGC